MAETNFEESHDAGDDIHAKLLEIERSARPNSERAERELRETLRKRLTAGDRFKHAAIGTAGLIATLVCGSMLLGEHLPPLTSAMLCGFGLVGVGWAAFAGATLWRGATGVPQQRFAAGLALGAATGTLGFASLATAVGRVDGSAAIGAVGMGIGMVALAAIFFLCQRLVESELRLRRKLLELEYRLALLHDQTRHATPGL